MFLVSNNNKYAYKIPNNMRYMIIVILTWLTMRISLLLLNKRNAFVCREITIYICVFQCFDLLSTNFNTDDFDKNACTKLINNTHLSLYGIKPCIGFTFLNRSIAVAMVIQRTFRHYWITLSTCRRICLGCISNRLFNGSK